MKREVERQVIEEITHVLSHSFFEPQTSEEVICITYDLLFLLFQMLISWLFLVHSSLVRKGVHLH